MTRPTTISAAIATIFTIANQNSVSPNALTVTRLSPMSTATVASAGIHRGRSGHQNVVYPAMAMTSAMPVTIQQNQYVHPVKKPAHGPRRSPAKSANE
jgi:hypothetical protein